MTIKTVLDQFSNNEIRKKELTERLIELELQYKSLVGEYSTVDKIRKDLGLELSEQGKEIRSIKVDQDLIQKEIVSINQHLKDLELKSQLITEYPNRTFLTRFELDKIIEFFNLIDIHHPYYKGIVPDKNVFQLKMFEPLSVFKGEKIPAIVKYPDHYYPSDKVFLFLTTIKHVHKLIEKDYPHLTQIKKDITLVIQPIEISLGFNYELITAWILD